MGLFSTTLPLIVALLAILAATVSLIHDTRTADWRSLAAPGALSAWCISVIVLPMLWRFQVPIGQGLNLHLYGIALFVLMFGRRLATVGTALSVIAYTTMYDGPWLNLGMNMLLIAILPAWFGELVMRGTRRFLPHHLFIYLLGNGLFGAMAVLVATGLVSLGAFWLWTTVPIRADVIAYMVLLAWGEAFITGFLLTMLTVYRPEWVLTFDDEVYLTGK